MSCKILDVFGGDAMHYYATLEDGTVVTHSSIIEKNEVEETVLVSFEQPTTNGFKTLLIEFPSYNVKVSRGFTEDEEFALLDYAKDNAPLLWEFARVGGGMNA